MKHIPAALTIAAAGLGLALSAVAQTPAKANGKALFTQRCAMCHSTEAGKVSPLGPNLSGVVGRVSGSTTFRHSPAMKASGITWTPAALDKFLTAPMAMVPGSRMAVSVPDKAQRAAIIAHLAKPGG